MIIVINNNKKPFTIIGKKKSGGGGGVLPEVAENEDILAIKNVDTVEGIVKMNNPNNISIQYSTNGSQFNEYTTASEVPIGVGEIVYFKWSEVISSSSNSTAIISSSVKYNVSGELKKGNNSNAYRSMFRDESNLTDASELQLTAMELANYCYTNMFQSCTSLTQAPQLPATTLATACYGYMFYGCTSLTTAPELPATTLASFCYQYMFSSCSSLTTAPELPATTLADWCYYNMFSNSTSLTQAPQLPATTLASNCYRGMFSSCTKLNYVKHHINEWDSSNASGWLNRVASSGTMYCPLNSTIPSDNASGIPSGWTRVNIDENGNVIPDEPEEPEVAENEALILTNLTDSQNTFTVNLPNDNTYSYKLNSTDEWQTTSGKNSFTVEPNSKLYLKDTYRTSFSTTEMITATANFKISGTLPNGNFGYAYSFMFCRNTYLTDASELTLPTTQLANYCYANMFQSCTNLTTAPELPATILATQCYNYMFNGCSSLTIAPELPATTMASSCYSYMFMGCSKLNYVKHHITEWNTSNATDWLKNVASSGTVYCPLNSTIPNNNTSGIPSGWLRVNIE